MLIREGITLHSLIGVKKLFPTSDIQVMILRPHKQQKIFWEDEYINIIII